MVDPERPGTAHLDDASWLTLSAVVERFEAAWAAHGDASIADFLPEISQPWRLQVLVELIKTDQEYRWQNAQRPLVESYLQQWPELGDCDETVAELLVAECLTRGGLGEPVQRTELEQRFPRIAGQIDLAEIEQQVHWETVSTGPDTADAGDDWLDTQDESTEPLSCEVFLSRLSGAKLLADEAVEECLARLPEHQRPADGRGVARRLVQSGQLTAYQGRTLVQGRDDPLVLGNYVILDRLGHGGMGQVFKAVHRRMERTVALKMLAPHLAQTPESLRRFQQEVKAAARLSHPNIVIAHDADEAAGMPFLVMEYVDGIDLATLVRQQGPLPPSLALDCILQAARGLQYAHQHGVVHRDIKPANLVLSVVTGHSSVVTGHSSVVTGHSSLVNGQWSVAADHGPPPTNHRSPITDHGQQLIVKILDMGLAHLESADAAQDELTGAGQIMGTVDYMAPEQAIDAHRADGRADIYGLGATLHYLLTGQSMYAGRTTAEKLLACQSGPIPSLGGVLTDLPPRLDAVFRRMVAKRPEDRYQTMAELIADLESLRSSVADRPASARATPQAGPLAELAITETLAAPQVATASELAAARSARVSDPAETADRRSPGSEPNRGEPAATPVSRPPWRRKWPVLAAAGAGGLLLIWLAVWGVIRDERGGKSGAFACPKAAA